MSDATIYNPLKQDGIDRGEAEGCNDVAAALTGPWVIVDGPITRPEDVTALVAPTWHDLELRQIGWEFHERRSPEAGEFSARCSRGRG